MNNKTKFKHRRLSPSALEGEKPMFDQVVPITKPTIPFFNTLHKKYKKVLESGMITNSIFVSEFERKVARYLGVKNAVAVNSCTNGLMLTMKVMKLKGEVIIPSFTFHATAHAVIWNHLKPIFVDCDPDTYNIDPQAVEKAITPRTSAILAVHIFGNPCSMKVLSEISRKYKLKLIFDAAHAIGSRYKNQHIGRFGDAEIFSCSPTKLLTTAEGGIVATNHDDLAEQIKVGRNYGDSGNYDSEFSGFNARMSEFHALLGIESLKILEKNVVHRNKMAALYKKLLSQIPGISFQKIEQGNRSSFKDFAILINEKTFGLSRNKLCEALISKNIIAKKYFFPPVHQQKAFAHYDSNHFDERLKVTLKISQNILCLPMFSHISEATVKKICLIIKKIHDFREEIN